MIIKIILIILQCNYLLKNSIGFCPVLYYLRDYLCIAKNLLIKLKVVSSDKHLICIFMIIKFVFFPIKKSQSPFSLNYVVCKQINYVGNFDNDSKLRSECFYVN